MNTIVLKLNNCLKHIRSYFPSPLPVGVTEFDVWATDIIKLAPIPYDESMKFALAAMIANMRHEAKFYVPKRTFALMLSNAASRQVAGFVMFETKRKQKEADEAAKLAKAAEAASAPQLQGI